MFFDSLILTNYKNHSLTELKFDQKINVLIGQNGVGKTNILDAIYYLSVFRSHIHHLDAQNIKQGEDFFRIHGKLSNKYEVVAKYSFRSKAIEINQVKVTKYSESFGHIPLIMACPNDIFLLHDGSEERRRLLDYTISIYDRTYLSHLNAYNQYLDQRNALLKNEENFDIELIKFYNMHLSSIGTSIYESRIAMMSRFQSLVNTWYENIAGKNENISIQYQSKLQSDSLANLLKNTLDKDKILKRTTAGIHRDDIKIEMNGVDFKKTGSQGQQKSLLYALRIAQAEYLSEKLEKKIIFLLDDFSDKLDFSRRNHLLDQIEKIDFVSQWFITDTNEENFKELKEWGKFFIGK